MIDARGLACPIPVLRVKQEIDQHHPDTLEVLVDNHPCVENVTRFAHSAGYTIAVRELEDEDFSLTLTKR